MPRSLRLGLFAAGVLWLVAAQTLAANASQGFATRLNLPAFQPLLNACLLLFLVLLGYSVLDWIGTRDGAVRSSNALPERPTAAREWAIGAAVGWGALLVAVLPMGLAGRLQPQFALGLSAWGSALLALLTLLISTLAIEAGFRGFLLRTLVPAVGPSAAAILLALLYALLLGARPNATALSTVVEFAAGLVFALAYFRTHALWMGWGLHFGWAASMAVLLGLPLGGTANFSSVVTTAADPPTWFTGGAYGPEGALFTLAVLAGTSLVLYRVSRDYAWAYTQPAIVPGGYPMDVPPPAPHAAMEAQTAPPPLVQIAVPAPPVPPPPRPQAMAEGDDSATADTLP